MAGKSMEFSYQELAKATNNFSSDNKIGQDRFRAVYFAELRGQKAAIKKINVQGSTEFLSELKVLKHVHHLNLWIRMLQPAKGCYGRSTNSKFYSRHYDLVLSEC
ncbi:lysM domain receptor-like kinase 3 [Arachis stenosperma]|uniref:lysM domain receptor-like kinase 3 n=1 Tax=Arachis stenosperma TaxID=217475 RepID=UPI0025ABEC21|nr:lysM domain receptor-like kinase 3 [Arachis stenosperma]